MEAGGHDPCCWVHRNLDAVARQIEGGLWLGLIAIVEIVPVSLLLRFSRRGTVTEPHGLARNMARNMLARNLLARNMALRAITLARHAHTTQKQHVCREDRIGDSIHHRMHHRMHHSQHSIEQAQHRASSDTTGLSTRASRERTFVRTK